MLTRPIDHSRNFQIYKIQIQKNGFSTRFTKRHFVRHKNTQKLEEAYLIQFLLLSLNLDSVFKFQIVASSVESPNFLSPLFFFSSFRLIFHQPAAAEQIILKMENGNHLEVAEFSKPNPNYLKSEKLE